MPGDDEEEENTLEIPIGETFEEIEEDLYAVLLDKSEDEIHRKVAAQRNMATKEGRGAAGAHHGK